MRWCPWADLNCRPLPYQGSALPLSYMGELFGAGEGNRTLTVSLEGFCSTIELHPHTHFLLQVRIFGGGRRIRTFEAYATDLQSAPFDRSGIPPKENASLLATQISVKIFFHLFL